MAIELSKKAALFTLWLTFLSSIPALAGENREWTFPLWSKEVLTPWFEAQPDQFMSSNIPSSGPVNLRYRAFLRPQPRANITIVHGYGERIEKFSEIVYDFYSAGFNVFILDQRGFGRSTRINPEGGKAIYVENFADYAKDLEQFLLQVVQPQGSARPSLLFAHSMGGLVSTQLLHDRPDLVAAAVFSAPMFRVKTHGVPLIMAELLTKLANRLGYGARYAFGQSDPSKPVFQKSGTQSLARWQYYTDFISTEKELPLVPGGASFHWLLEALRSTQSAESKTWTAGIKTPLLIFQAENDTYVDNARQDEFCSQLKECRTVLVPGTRHEIFREQDSARTPYLQSILQFYNSQIQQSHRMQMARP